MSVITRSQQEDDELIQSTGEGEGESIFAQKMMQAKQKEQESGSKLKGSKKKAAYNKPTKKTKVAEDNEVQQVSENQSATKQVVEEKKVSKPVGSSVPEHQQIAHRILYCMKYDVEAEKGSQRNIVKIDSSDALKIAEKINTGELAQDVYNAVASELRQFIHDQDVVLQRYYRLIVDRKLLAIGKWVKMLSNGKLYLKTIIKKQKVELSA